MAGVLEQVELPPNWQTPCPTLRPTFGLARLREGQDEVIDASRRARLAVAQPKGRTPIQAACAHNANAAQAAPPITTASSVLPTVPEG